MIRLFLSGLAVLSLPICGTAQQPAAAAPESARPGIFEKQEVEVDGQKFAFRLLKPAVIEGGKKYPCILFLHGAGERGTDNELQLKHFARDMAQPDRQTKYPCFLVVPQCRPDQKWADVAWNDKKSGVMAEQPNLMMRYAIAALDKVQKEQPVDGQRTYLTGISMGGFGSWELATRHPERFACVAPVCGGGDESKAAALKNLPVWAWHGAADTVVWPERSRGMVAAVKAAGGNARLTELPGVGHDSWTPAYNPSSGLLDWMFSQTLGQKGAAAK